MKNKAEADNFAQHAIRHSSRQEKPDVSQIPHSAAILNGAKNALPGSKGVTSLIKCEDQANSQTAILNSLAQFKRRKNQVGQRLKPLSSGNELLPTKTSNDDVQAMKKQQSLAKKSKREAHSQVNSSAYANGNNNTLVESEARPEQFNFTFNPKDEEIEGAAAEAAATGFPGNYTSR